jgi:hypothetical protein
MATSSNNARCCIGIYSVLADTQVRESVLVKWYSNIPRCYKETFYVLALQRTISRPVLVTTGGWSLPW